MVSGFSVDWKGGVRGCLGAGFCQRNRLLDHGLNLTAFAAVLTHQFGTPLKKWPYGELSVWLAQIWLQKR